MQPVGSMPPVSRQSRFGPIGQFSGAVVCSHGTLSPGLRTKQVGMEDSRQHQGPGGGGDGSPPRMGPGRSNVVAGGLIGAGAVLIVLTFLLAFTIFGEVSAVVGAALFGLGCWQAGRRTRQTSPGNPGPE